MFPIFGPLDLSLYRSLYRQVKMLRSPLGSYSYEMSLDIFFWIHPTIVLFFHWNQLMPIFHPGRMLHFSPILSELAILPRFFHSPPPIAVRSHHVSRLIPWNHPGRIL